MRAPLYKILIPSLDEKLVLGKLRWDYVQSLHDVFWQIYFGLYLFTKSTLSEKNFHKEDNGDVDFSPNFHFFFNLCMKLKKWQKHGKIRKHNIQINVVNQYINHT